ncbi:MULTISPECIES: hypothetical protein [Streptomyces]|uniref:Uncharacterized protein n=1 Tax=Streptomyces solicathayae TaxID=3081768 RepID=A0ABZ0M492_9ACTN|nr:hypothetical protein [Streptomyces sp. HUAS YS2]WOX26402.1 hypothetical protein R2D22_35525 [Streptomyces sp. HUAS YS2]
MSALSHGSQAAAYASPYRIEVHEGPQTLAELRAALAVIDAAELVAFNAKLDAARFGAEHSTVISEARHLVALRTRPEVRAAVRASLAGDVELMSAEDLWAEVDKGTAA